MVSQNSLRSENLRKLQCNLHISYIFNILVYWRNTTVYISVIYITLQYISKEPHLCTHVCVGRQICYSTVIPRKSKLKIFMLYLRVTRDTDLKKKKSKPTSGKGKELHGKNMEKIVSISWFTANHENNFSLLKQRTSVLLGSVSFLTMQVVLAIFLN